MNLTGGIVLYAVMWFVTLLIVMPIGQVSQAESGEIVPGTPAGAPGTLKYKRKLIITTVFTTVVWGILAYIILSGMITREQLMNFDLYFRG